MTLALVTACKLAAANVTGEGLLTGVCADVSGEVVAAAEVAHADAALERFLARMNADVACELIGPREAPLAGFHGAGIGTLMWWCLTWPVRVLAHTAGLNELRLVDALQLLRARLCGEGLDGRKRCK